MSDFTPFQIGMLKSLLGGDGPRQHQKASVRFIDPFEGEVLTKAEETAAGIKEPENQSPLVKSVLNLLNAPGNKIERLAFEADPAQTNLYYSLYRMKAKLLPDHILKRLTIQDDLVAAIVNTRANQVAAFGRPQPDRFSTGFKIEPEAGLLASMGEEKREELQKRIDKAAKKLVTCGEVKGWADQDQLTLGQCFYMTARNSVTVGRIAMEIIHVTAEDGQKRFHSFRPIDAGTIYRAAPQKEAGDQVRRNALDLLERLKNKRLEPERYQNDEYAWVQVVEGRPVQAFTAEECVVHNFYPVTDVELGGYPLTPLDTVIAAVTTHINITNHNKLYFQSGRAARGMIVVKSADVDENMLNQIRQQFNASINSVGNAWRMPVFGIDMNDEVVWQPIDNSSRDMEFSYLSDQNARTIMAAFQISPEELPGYQHLSRGTNSQALSESNNEFKLEAARDVGLRPLLAEFQNFLNARILPLIDEDLAKICSIKLVGLDAETAEKESVRTQQDMGVWMNMDDVYARVEKKPLGMAWAGQIPLNPAYQQLLFSLFSVGQILEKWCGIEGAGDPQKHPELAYYRDNYWMQFQELRAQMQQAQAQAQQPQEPPEGDEGNEDLTRSLDQLIGTLSKSEGQLPPSRRQLLLQQRKLVRAALDAWEKEAPKAMDDIIGVVDRFVPKKG